MVNFICKKWSILLDNQQLLQRNCKFWCQEQNHSTESRKNSSSNGTEQLRLSTCVKLYTKRWVLVSATKSRLRHANNQNKQALF